MKLIQGLTFTGQTFTIDDKKLVDCTLVDCTIRYGGGPVILERTAIRSCRYLFTGHAKTTLEFLDCVGLLPEHVAPRNHSVPSRQQHLIQ